MYVKQRKLYFGKEDADALKSEKSYVRKRYYAIVLSTQLPHKNIASRFSVSTRTLRRWIKRYNKNKIAGLRCESRRPKSSPKKTPNFIEAKIESVRKTTGFGRELIATLVNRSLQNEGLAICVQPRTVHRILVRKDAIAAKKPKKKYKSFEWGKPGELMQIDITTLESIPLLTCLDDHSRFFWAKVLANETDDEVIEKLEDLPKAENILTDNGSQFSRTAELVRRYCEKNNINHIWATVRHPQTLGKLGAAQKHLKNFLKAVGFSGIRDLKYKIELYLKFVNNGKTNSSTRVCAAERYFKKIDESWYNEFVEAFKLKEVLTIDK